MIIIRSGKNHSRKTPGHGLILAAAVALTSHAALAAAPAGDAEAQARALLTGASQSAQVAGILASTSRSAPRIDVQEQAQRLLLGVSTPGSPAVRPVAVGAVAIRTADARSTVARSHGAQESAQRMILGKTE